jgi:drug/metabolite transporter (DMT)-like permease
MVEPWAAALVLASAFIGALGSLYFKKAADRMESNLSSILKNKDLITGLMIYGASTVLYVIAIKGGELSVLFPLVSTGYIWVAIFSIKYMGEKMNTLKIAGITSIIFGVILIGLGSAS